MAYTIAFFGSKPYDEASFNEKNKEYGFELRYYKGHLNKHNVILTQGVDAVCIFVERRFIIRFAAKKCDSVCHEICCFLNVT